jgi:hypothetical protein
MLIKNYVPMGDNKQVKMILELAHKEVAAVAERYITIINSLFSDTSMNPGSAFSDMASTCASTTSHQN